MYLYIMFNIYTYILCIMYLYLYYIYIYTYIIIMILSLNKSTQQVQSNIIPDIGMNSNFFYSFKFPVLQLSGEWL